MVLPSNGLWECETAFDLLVPAPAPKVLTGHLCIFSLLTGMTNRLWFHKLMPGARVQPPPLQPVLRGSICCLFDICLWHHSAAHASADGRWATEAPRMLHSLPQAPMSCSLEVEAFSHATQVFAFVPAWNYFWKRRQDVNLEEHQAHAFHWDILFLHPTFATVQPEGSFPRLPQVGEAKTVFLLLHLKNRRPLGREKCQKLFCC